MDVNYWVSVRAMAAPDVYSSRALAITVSLDEDLPCATGDLQIVNVSVNNDPYIKKVGRDGTATAFGTEEELSVQLLHNGDNDISDVQLFYQINDTDVINENLTQNVEAGSNAWYDFSSPADLSEAGVYNISAWLSSSNDTTTENDTLTGNYQLIQLANNPITLNYDQNFNDAIGKVYTQNLSLIHI